MNYVVLPVGAEDFFVEQSANSWKAFCKKSGAEFVRIDITPAATQGKPWLFEWARWEGLLNFVRGLRDKASGDKASGDKASGDKASGDKAPGDKSGDKSGGKSGGTGNRVIFADPRNTLCLDTCPVQIFGEKDDKLAISYHQGDRYWRVVQMVEAAAWFGNAEFAPESYVDDGLIALDSDWCITITETLLKFKSLGIAPSTALSFMLHRMGKTELARGGVLSRHQAETAWAQAKRR